MIQSGKKDGAKRNDANSIGADGADTAGDPGAFAAFSKMGG